MKNIWTKINFWFWWNFRASERDKVNHDVHVYGVGVFKDGKRVSIKKLVDLNN